jgi:hypothetical protein
VRSPALEMSRLAAKACGMPVGLWGCQCGRLQRSSCLSRSVGDRRSANVGEEGAMRGVVRVWIVALLSVGWVSTLVGATTEAPTSFIQQTTT